MLTTDKLTIRFGGHVAVNSVTCSFEPGTLTAIVGPNGAGKTTYFNLISGQLRATEGRVSLQGRDLTGLAPSARTRAGLGRAFQLTNLFPALSVLENVRLAVQATRQGAHRRGMNLWSIWSDHRALLARAQQILEQVALWARRDEPVSALPHGDQRKLEVALLMALEPQVYMFDEPTAGMSHDEAPVILDLIRELKKDRSKTILLVEHKMDVVRELADRIIVLTNGTLVADGKPAEVIASPVVQQAYLGLTPQDAVGGTDAPLPSQPSPVRGKGRTAMSELLLELQGVHTHIGAYHILHGVDLAVPRGEVTMLLGRNGAGKTTTLRTIMGLWQASQGSIRFGQQDITRLATPAIAQLNIAYVPENMGIFADLTVKENLLLAARSASHAARMDRSRLDWIYELFPAVQKFWDHPAGKLSGGQKQMVAVARAIVEPRDLLIVDEPSKGLAPAIINNMIEAFAQLKAGGVSILLVEQNLAFAKRLGDGVAVMDNGRVVHAGRMADLAADEELQQSLLGLAL